MTVTRAVRSVIAAATRAGSSSPPSSTGRYVTENPRPESARRALSTEKCSMFEVTTWSLPRGASASSPLIARLLASVPPEVKTISSGFAPISAATSARAWSTAREARCPSG